MNDVSRSNGAMRDPRFFANCLKRIAQDKSRDDFRVLFEYYAPRLKSFLIGKGADAAAAEELTQDVMATVWAKAGQFDPSQASVSTWVFRIARNRQIDALRRANRPDLDPNDPIFRPADPDHPDTMVIRAEAEAQIRIEIAKLPAEQKELLRASFYDGLPHAEIARTFSLPLGTVKSRIRLAFNKLRNSLEDLNSS
ncbi:MAG: sigma-70 family RNA polymerase sigma factor [Pseudomonadota bacterium]